MDNQPTVPTPVTPGPSSPLPSPTPIPTDPVGPSPNPTPVSPPPPSPGTVPPLGPNPVPPTPQQPKPPKSKKRLIIIIVLVLIVAAGVAYYFLRPTEEAPPATTPTTSEKAPEISNTVVQITATGLNPATVKIPVGSQVTWQNSDKANHRVTADPYPTKASLPDLDSNEPIAPNDSFGFIFEKAGTFTYNDYLNPTNKAYQGTVIVE